MDKILITGASGFIGSHFHNSIPHERIINLDLNEPRFAHRSLYIQGDIRKEEDVKKALHGNPVKTILSLAAKHHDFGIGHDEYFDTNEEGTKVVCNAATEAGINEIIFYSSVAVYGDDQNISSERKNPNPSSPYGASKLAGEKVLTDWAGQKPDRKVVVIRPTVVFGENNVANMYSLIKQIDSGLYFHIGKADNIKSIAYVKNLVQATLFLKDRMKPGLHVYNYADQPQLTSRQIADTIASALGKKIRFSLPLPLATVLGIPFDLMIKVSGKNLPISTARIKKLNTQTLHSAEKIFNEGYKATYTTIDGLRNMAAWYLKAKNTPGPGGQSE
jgi:GlcNAc-P-P-Und epimerase